MDSIFNIIYYYFPNTPIQVTIRQIIKALLDAIINAKYALVAKGGDTCPSWSTISTPKVTELDQQSTNKLSLSGGDGC